MGPKEGTKFSIVALHWTIKSANLNNFSNIALSTVVLSNSDAFKVPFFKHEAISEETLQCSRTFANLKSATVINPTETAG